MLLSLLSKRSLEADSRDAYGFALRPQHIQRYREYADIHKEEEEERVQKWKNFLEEQVDSVEVFSAEEEALVVLPAEIIWNCVERTREEAYVSSDKSDSDGPPERDLDKLAEESENKVLASEEVDKEEDKNHKEQEGEECLVEESVVDAQDHKHKKKELHSRETEKGDQQIEEPEKETKVRNFKAWSSVRPSLNALQNILSLRVKVKMGRENNQKSMKRGHHPPPAEEMKSPKLETEETAHQNIRVNGVADGVIDTSSEKEQTADAVFPETYFSLREELELLVRGGVPRDLRGEVWQAFIGVKARRVEKYYEQLLAEENSTNEDNDPADSTVAFMKWRKQIEKDIPRTFPGHPALNDLGRDSLRRILLAYARHNPSVGYCQAMNFFAGLLLLLMPEENAFWTLVGIIDDYFEGYYTEEMIESQVDQLVFEDLMRERFPKLVNHLDYLGVQVAWITGPWFLSIFINVLPWESVLRVWDVILFEGNRVMLFRTALAVMDLYGPALVTTKDAGDAITLLQTLTGSAFDSSQLVLTACMGYLAVTEDKLEELREKHRPSVIEVVEERLRRGKVWKDSKGLASKLYSFKHEPGPLVEEKRNGVADKPSSEHGSNLDDILDDMNIDTEVDSLPDLQEQVVWLKVELCRLLQEKRAAILRAEELETALMEMVKEDNRRQLSAKIEQLEQDLDDMRKALSEKKEQEAAMLQVLMRIEQEQRITEEARLNAEKEAAAQANAIHELQEKYDEAMASLAQMEKRVVMAESMLEATIQYESGQAKAMSSPRAAQGPGFAVESPRRRLSLFGWRDRSKERVPGEGLGEKNGE